MKVIDLLNKIANGEEVPKKVKYDGIFFKNKDGDLLNSIDCSLFEHRGDGHEKLLPMLNDEVEILEEEKKIPEKLGYFDLTKDKNEKDENDDYLELHYTGVADTFDDVYNKINEIIDYLESKGD